MGIEEVPELTIGLQGIPSPINVKKAPIAEPSTGVKLFIIVLIEISPKFVFPMSLILT